MPGVPPSISRPDVTLNRICAVPGGRRLPVVPQPAIG